MEPKNMSEISILFVDDEKLIRNSFARELRAEGFKVTAVADGSDAIEELGEDQIRSGDHRPDDARR